MSMSVGGYVRKGKRRAVAEINVTPLVDVMLVLLVIFMITAPVLKEGYAVSVPEADATISIEVPDAHIITVTAQGHVLRHNAKSDEERYDKLGALVEDLRAYKETCAKENKRPVVLVVGDRDARYERIIQVWNAARSAGLEHVSFQLEPGTPNRETKP